ncbi:DUF2207 domain-containing protein [Hydrogenimonas urashimensis]|uniref:DUF2207 domain-containing protein n=1 Tax=Hydrogenimonas urashimensis TaxID=2740515 RepID=UPI001915B50C|nr:DUF2207 domain-containing protein [Hydrogenimonas urashimensis]
MRALLLFQLFALLLFAESIRQYDVTIDLHEDGSLDVEEIIDYDFGTAQRHGIFRDIPKNVTGRYGPRSIGLADFRVMRDNAPEPFETLNVLGDAGAMVRLKIGRGDIFLTGLHRYTIDYRVAHGILRMDDGRDAMRWNAIGTGWEVPIHNVHVMIRVPEKLAQQSVTPRTFSGPYGSIATRAKIEKSGARLYEATIDSLRPHEGLTVELAFEKEALGQSGDFNEGVWGWVQYRWPWIFLLFYTAGLFNYWYRHGKDPAIGAIAPMYQPPENIDVLQAGLLIDQFADNKDIAAAIIDLARMGYLRIKEEPTDNLLASLPLVGRAFESEQIVLIRQKKETGNLSKEYRIVLNELLFPYSDRFVLIERSDSRAKRFQRGYEKINGSLYEWSWQKGYMQENPSRARIRFIGKAFSVMLPFMALAAYQSARMIGGFEVILPLLFLSVFLVAGFMLIMFQKDLASRIVGIGFVLVPIAIGVSIVAEAGGLHLFFTMPLVILLIGLLPVLFFAKYMGVYTRKGAEAYRHLLGFKEFIKRVKEDELKRFLEKDPAYLDRALPYAMVFSVADHWLKFYALLEASTPAWFDGNRQTLLHLDRSLEKFSDTAQTRTSSGGGSGGGSFSGGGGGGGGGGSW